MIEVEVEIYEVTDIPVALDKRFAWLPEARLAPESWWQLRDPAFTR